jgi:hypothetical protein
MSFVAVTLIAVSGGSAASGTVVEILVCFVLLKVFTYYYLFYIYLSVFKLQKASLKFNHFFYNPSEFFHSVRES